MKKLIVGLFVALFVLTTIFTPAFAGKKNYLMTKEKVIFTLTGTGKNDALLSSFASNMKEIGWSAKILPEADPTSLTITIDDKGELFAKGPWLLSPKKKAAFLEDLKTALKKTHKL